MNEMILLSGNNAGTQPGGAMGIGTIVIYALILVALYFFMIRPNSKKKKEEAELRNNLQIGDNITTIGGIIGRIVAIKDEEDCIVIETSSDRTKLKMKKWCISTVDKELPKTETPKKKGFFSKNKNKEEK